MNEVGPWAILGLSWVLVVLASGLCLCYAIRADAAARGSSAFGWGVWLFLLLPIAIPAYAVYRTRLPARREPAGPLERVLGAVGIGGMTAVIGSALVSPPDPFTQALYTMPLLIVAVPAAYLVCYEPGWRALGT
ncbi:DUF7534 family protein [Natrinema salaciae]|uniref:Uncharacterized protein n=1 Tax=Natrinema salaciae TaxID=1186196 RepID=A0A1H9A0F1_9EURY|nr:hypothetical protein [Natrinema salaciae]SEP69478.1 hypothetical protein SAMN04489841_0299 [Natrinema salaciae]